MVQYYTLEQAAQLLRVTPDQLKEMVKSGKVRAFQDRGTLRFRTQEIDELARKMGPGSDSTLPLGEAPPLSSPSSVRRRSKVSPAPKKKAESEDFDFNLNTDDDQSVPLGNLPSKAGKSKPGSPAKGSTRPSKLSSTPSPRSSDSDVRLVADGSDLDFQLSEEAPPRSSKSKSPVPKPRPSRLGPVTPPRGDSSVRLVPPQPASDSDVKIVPDSHDDSSVPLGQSRPRTPSDSDIRLEADDQIGDLGGNPAGHEPLVTEEIDLDLEAMKAEESAAKNKKATRARPAPAPVKLPTSSPFELSESDLDIGSVVPPAKGAAKPLEDSSSDFELSPLGGSEPNLELGTDELSPLAPADESSAEEVALGGAPVSGATGASGINLEDPADRGISLEADGSDEMEFELSLDEGSTPKPSSMKKGPEVSEFELSLDEDDPAASSDSEFELSLDDSSSSELALEDSEAGSDSEFELTLDEEGGLQPVDETSDLAEGEDSGLFEETDFEVPALGDESGSEAMALDDDSSSDFDLAVDDSAVGEEEGASESQVVPLDDEAEADQGAETVARPAAKKGKQGKKAPAADLEDEEGLDLDLDADEEAADEIDEEIETDDEEGAPVRTREVPVEAVPASWGVLPALAMFPCIIILFVAGLMGFELIQGMWGYHKSSKMSGLIIEPIAKMFDDSLPKE